MEEAATRERRAQARAALTPQVTGASEKDLVDARMQRLKLEGTPRVKRTKRQMAPPLSPIPATTDLTDFMMPLATTQGESVDYGTLAQKMMNDIFAANGMAAAESPQIRVEDASMPVSPSPVTGDLGPLGGSPGSAEQSVASPVKGLRGAMLRAGQSDESLQTVTPEVTPVESDADEDEGDRTINSDDAPRI